MVNKIHNLTFNSYSTACSYSRLVSKRYKIYFSVEKYKYGYYYLSYKYDPKVKV